MPSQWRKLGRHPPAADTTFRVGAVGCARLDHALDCDSQLAQIPAIVCGLCQDNCGLR